MDVARLMKWETGLSVHNFRDGQPDGAIIGTNSRLSDTATGTPNEKIEYSYWLTHVEETVAITL